MTGLSKPKLGCSDEQEYLNDTHSWSFIIQETTLVYDNEQDKVNFESHTLQCPHSDGFCEPTLKHANTNVWFPKGVCLIFHATDCMGSTSKLRNRFWLEVDDFSKITGKNTEKDSKDISPTAFPYTPSSLGTETPRLI